MKTVAIITSTRAEFGLLMPVIKELRRYENSEWKAELLVTGTHLYSEYGYTIDEIKRNKIRIDLEIKIPVASKDAVDISHNQAVALEKFTALFQDRRYAGIVILGDRYEMLAVAIAAGNTHTPIFHLCGGDTTEGAMDEWIRHSITKMSYLHFPTNQESYRRILQLGEDPDRVFNYGSTSVDNILNSATLSKKEALDSIHLSDCRYALCTYHPVTMEEGDPEKMITDFLHAISEFPELEFILTKSNADQGGSHMNELFDAANGRIKNFHVFSSLGVVRYLSLMKSAEFVLGNSSSGIIEAPSFGIPTIDIGDRQRGRYQSESILHCFPDTDSIVNAIKKAEDPAFRSACKKVCSPYGGGHAAEKIADKIREVVMEGTIDLKKTFYDYVGMENK